MAKTKISSNLRETLILEKIMNSARICFSTLPAYSNLWLKIQGHHWIHDEKLSQMVSEAPKVAREPHAWHNTVAHTVACMVMCVGICFHINVFHVSYYPRHRFGRRLRCLIQNFISYLF